jgi:16S rRNA (adenine1518-N6/adenine1519-N6)-dimethyltransferase
MRDRPSSNRPPRRKRFGQHFLHDPAVIDRIVSAVNPRSDDRVVEIGPGRGALTRRLLAAGTASADVIEIDRDLATLLRDDLGSHPELTVHAANALEFDFTTLAQQRGGRLRVIGNLPYNISTPLLFHLLDHSDAIEDLHIMLPPDRHACTIREH